MSPHAPIDRTAVAETLHYGAPINRPPVPLSLPFSTDVLKAARARRIEHTSDKDRLLTEGARLWQDVCRRVGSRATHPILLPLSAGLDSRAVLAGLRSCDIPVHTVTYGVPGSFDYELAPAVAQAAGASHERIDLQSVEITRDRLLETVTNAEKPSSVLDMFYNAEIARRHGDQWSYVNGFAGDVLAGKNLGKAEGLHWPEACQAFSVWCRSSRTAVLTEPDMDPVAALPKSSFVSTELLPSIQQLDYAVRQQRLVRPIVCPPGVEVFTPFLDPQWCVFMLGLPESLRNDRAFFVELFQKSHPKLFALPTTASGGLQLGASDKDIQRYRKRLRRRRRMRIRLNALFSRVRVPPANRTWQYLDFRTLLRQDSALYALFADSLARLDEQGIAPWIDATALLQAHRAGKQDHFKALNALFNLELILAARPELFVPTD